MASIAVAGATGLVGRAVVAALRAAGHEPVEISRAAGVDVVAGTGLDRALSGVSAVVDVLNRPAQDADEAVAFFETAARNLIQAEQRALVGHHVLLSIVNVDGIEGNAHYAGKRAQERVVEAGPVTEDLVDMARRTLSARGDRTRLRASWRDGPYGVDWAGEVLLPGDRARLGTTTFDTWLGQQRR